MGLKINVCRQNNVSFLTNASEGLTVRGGIGKISIGAFQGTMDLGVVRTADQM